MSYLGAKNEHTGQGINRLAPPPSGKQIKAPGFGKSPASADDLEQKQDVLLVLEPRELVRGCLTLWLGAFCGEFETLGIADVETSTEDDRLARAAVALVRLGPVDHLDGRLDQQIERLRAISPNLPIAVMADLDDTGALENLLNRLAVQGFIPTSSSMKVAAAALRLVMAGGRYFPPVQRRNQAAAPAAPHALPRPVQDESLARLTPRETAVLNVLALGAQNKIIAFRLGMSLSTVKAHVHSIIRKLNVRNRTEVVVAARAMQGRELRPNDDAVFGAAPQFSEDVTA